MKESLRFELREPPFDSALLAGAERVCDTWLADTGGSEKGYSLGRFDPAYREWGPLALAYHDKRLVAFANVPPRYVRNGTVSVDLMRHVPDAPAALGHGLPVGARHALGAGAEIRALQPPHGATVQRRLQPVRASTNASPRSCSATATVDTTIKVYDATRKNSAPTGPAPTLPIQAACECRDCWSIWRRWWQAGIGGC